MIDIKYPNNISSESGYQFNSYTFDDFNLDLGVDNVYILHLVNNGRLENINNQLKKLRPKKISILFNEGYKSKKKPTYIDEPCKDLFHGNLHILKDAYVKNYNNILILEDDFVFSKLIIKKHIQKEIKDFILSKNYNLYNLGSLGFKILERQENHMHVNKSYCATAIIFSRNAISKFNDDSLSQGILDKMNSKKSNRHWDVVLSKEFDLIYSYRKALIYQVISMTENRKISWGDYGEGHNIDFFYKKYNIDICEKVFKTSKRPKTIFNIWYCIAKFKYSTHKFKKLVKKHIKK